MFRKVLSVLFSAIIVISGFSVLPVSFNAEKVELAESGATRTQAEAVQWIKDRGNEGWWGNIDGANGCQCVDLVMAYYQYFGYGIRSGHAYSYQWNHEPAGSNWYYSNTPIPGSVFVKGNDNTWTYGHVGLVYAVDGNTMYTVETNLVSPYDGGQYYAKAQFRTRNINFANTFINPDFVDPTPQNNPTSTLDSVSGGTGTVHVRGWTFDIDDPTQSLSVHVYIGGSFGTPGVEGVQISANTPRKDVDNVYHTGEFHGFDAVIPTSKSGTQEIYVYAINIGSGENTEIDHKTVYISPDTENPICESVYLSMITSESYRVCVVPKDNVGLKSVRIATWTQDDQSDLIWHDALFNGSETYYIDLYRSDYSKTKNSFYHNHIYIYDYAGNYAFAEKGMDYKITSDTGKSVSEGEYRIVTAVNENKALDVEYGSIQSGANIEIYSNLAYSNQTFNLLYLNNGFYTIANSYSELVLDVAGDTYVNNTNVMQYNSNGGANQEWMIKPSGDGYYYIISRTNGLALDVTNAEDRDGANVAVHTQNQATAQKWKLRRVLKDDMVSITGWTPKGGIYQPTAKVVVDGQTLTKDVDYTVSTYIDNETLYAKITGIGNYCDSISVEYQEKTIYLGDVDGDDEVSIIDATLIQRKLVEMPVSIFNELAADIDGNGLDITDATYIQRYLAEIPTPYLIGEPIQQS